MIQLNKTITFSKDETYHVQQVKVSEHETTPPEYFNEGSLLKAMENPQNYIQLNDKSTLIPFINGRNWNSSDACRYY